MLADAAHSSAPFFSWQHAKSFFSFPRTHGIIRRVSTFVFFIFFFGLFVRSLHFAAAAIAAANSNRLIFHDTFFHALEKFCSFKFVFFSSLLFCTPSALSQQIETANRLIFSTSQFERIVAATPRPLARLPAPSLARRSPAYSLSPITSVVVAPSRFGFFFAAPRKIYKHRRALRIVAS